jgi:23S rRNA (adenine2030-N6)-methyltransferase
MNYRHAFHAGNFADLAKHAVLLAVLRAYRPRQVIDTHAGAGLYDLAGEDARRTGEAAQGVGLLMEDPAPPAALATLKAAVTRANPGGGLRWYPGSPRLIAEALPPGGRYTGFELHPEAHQALRRALAGSAGEAVLADGYVEAASRLGPSSPRPTLLLVDPPFERPDDYDRVAALTARASGAGALIWLPLKDLETYDAFMSRLEVQRPRSLVAAEVRLQPLHDPMRMNGCALVLLDLPDLDAEVGEVCAWVAGRCGGPRASSQVQRLAG